ncbi:hypothetical protein [Rubripirellula reticaptiva]|uniref:Uncharacterized protein n=1 Tax=Rubripirellula reticaptiva TaxID=2528013 RepID=A0A5C6EHT1_9BACT|nr:hypothetical protein [Rubripirellula reticaptiva]TWU48100.1 hypothetical protein Poly59_49450 [Rubripirellula reticaptiva]
MARQTHDREDLFRDGTQMPYRGRIQIGDAEVVVGFRTGGAASLYWDQDPVFQFNSDHEVRRVYFAGDRYAANAGKLVRLIQKRSDHETTTERLRLDQASVADDVNDGIDSKLQFCLAQLRCSCRPNSGEPNDAGEPNDQAAWEVTGESKTEFLARLDRWLGTVGNPAVTARGPAVSSA